jgi:hypothetical protein
MLLSLLAHPHGTLNISRTQSASVTVQNSICYVGILQWINFDCSVRAGNEKFKQMFYKIFVFPEDGIIHSET